MQALYLLLSCNISQVPFSIDPYTMTTINTKLTKLATSSTTSLDMSGLCPRVEELAPFVEKAVPGTFQDVEFRVYGSKATYSAYVGRPNSDVSWDNCANDILDARGDDVITHEFAKCLKEGGERSLTLPTKKHPNGMLVTWKPKVNMKITCKTKSSEMFKQLFKLYRKDE